MRRWAKHILIQNIEVLKREENIAKLMS